MLGRILVKFKKGRMFGIQQHAGFAQIAVCLQFAMQILDPARINTQVAYFKSDLHTSFWFEGDAFLHS